MELVRADLDVRVRARLQQVLAQAASDPEAAPALRRFFGTTAFTIPVDADRGALAELSAATRRTREAIE
jgi:phosphonate transport system substrate-binding protein